MRFLATTHDCAVDRDTISVVGRRRSRSIVALTQALMILAVATTGLLSIATAQGAQDPADLQRGRSPRDSEIVRRFRLLDRNAIWTPVGRIRMPWKTFHTQGLVRIGDTFYVSAVDVLERSVRNGVETDALYDRSLDRSTGAGRGWLFKFTSDGTLVGRVELTDGAVYHPGGIDYDGTSIWVPVAEYRPNSRSHVYRVDPDTLTATRVFTAPDHIGGIVHDVREGTLHGVSWDSRRLYTWRLSGPGEQARVVSSDWVPNAQSYVAYQDCHYQDVGYMLCGGGGGLDLVDLRDARPTHQVPVTLVIDDTGPNAGLSITNNAFWIEPTGPHALRAYFMTERDNQADLLIYDITPWIHRSEADHPTPMPDGQ